MQVTLDWGDVAASKYKNAFDLFKKDDFEGSVAILEEEMVREPDKHGYYALGQSFIALGDYARAIASLLQAMKMDNLFHEAICLLGDVYMACKQGMPAVEAYGQAVARDPANEKYKQKLIIAVGGMVFKKTNPNLKGVLIECLESDQAEMTFMGVPWFSMVERDALVGPYYKLSKYRDYKAFKKGLERFPNCDGLIEPFFLTGLGKFIVPRFSFERWVKNLRRYLLESIVEGKSLFSDESDIELITCALSRYCFLTDYIMSCLPEEEALLEKLDVSSLAGLACYGCYKPLYALPDAREIAAGLKGGNHVSQIPKSQIEDYLVQQEIRKEIRTLGAIEDKVSMEVQGQYEEFPYPRWNVVVKDLFNPEIEGHLKGKAAEILIAGCGTGKEAAYMSYVFPDARITAVDLSKSSLSYAVFKAHQLGLDNIDFYQADIMNLADLPDWQGRFDYIASGGVLHHMRDPFAGWKVLNGLLKDGGLMRLGLYSRHARQAVNEARAVIEDKGISSDASSIMKFRDNVGEHLKHKAIKKIEGLYDYYNLPECRDLLFHVQEHQFDLLKIKDHLKELGLEFLRFYHDPKVLEKYHIQNAKTDPLGRNLESWDRFEKKNPDTFIGMYNFWCRKS